jgi:RNA polymerase sigma-70 factor, ECF subfamily
VTPPVGGGPRHDTFDDATLVAALAGRDEVAMEELYRRYGGSVAALALRILGDRALADDVAQDVFLGLWRAPERFDPERGRLRTLLLTQTHGRCVDVIRTRNARTAREEKVASEPPAPADAVDAALMALTEAEQVREALAQLPYEERSVIELAYFGANTYRQVAMLLNLPEGTVKGRIRAGLRRLHALLNDPADATTGDETGSGGSGSRSIGATASSNDRGSR